MVATLLAMSRSEIVRVQSRAAAGSSPSNRCRPLPECCSSSAPEGGSGACWSPRTLTPPLRRRWRPAAVAARDGLGHCSLLRLSVGSATVSVITAASIMAPLVAGMPAVNKEFSSSRLAPGPDRVARQRRRVLAGQGIPEHERPQTLATWTIIETIVSVGGPCGRVTSRRWLFERGDTALSAAIRGKNRTTGETRVLVFLIFEFCVFFSSERKLVSRFSLFSCGLTVLSLKRGCR